MGWKGKWVREAADGEGEGEGESGKLHDVIKMWWYSMRETRG